MNDDLRKRRIESLKSLGRHQWYVVYAFNRFSIGEAIRMSVKYWLWPIISLDRLRFRANKWLKRDKRPMGYGQAKYAINRDGGLYMVECPNCGEQDVEWWEAYKVFHCPYGKCNVYFSVHTEDGVVKLMDHRKGDTPLPVVGILDPYAKIIRIGVSHESPSWWKRREICRDLHGGKDAHGHKEYKIVSSPLSSVGKDSGANMEEVA